MSPEHPAAPPHRGNDTGESGLPAPPTAPRRVNENDHSFDVID